jgi:apocytochrome f
LKTIVVPFTIHQRSKIWNGQRGGLNVGAVVILPDGFKLAPKARLEDHWKAKTKVFTLLP